MFGIEFFVALFVSAVIVYFIRKKLEKNKKIEEAPLRQKDIKRNMKRERKKQQNKNFG